MMSKHDKVVKVLTDSYYGKFGDRGALGRYVVKCGFRGFGKVHHLYMRYGYDMLVARLIRLRLRYPYWSAGNDILHNLQAVVHHERINSEWDRFVSEIANRPLQTFRR